MITFKGLDYKHQNVEIYNLNGQLVGNVTLNAEGLASFDLSVYNSGILIIKAGTLVEKVVLIK